MTAGDGESAGRSVAAAGKTSGMKVFVSYSRDDVTFADQLSVALEDRGFEPILDRHNIDAAENWRERLGALILSCDAVAFVLTDNSAASPICAWEVEEAKRLGKRILPVVPQEVKTPPLQALADLNWIHFYATADIPGSGMFDGLRKLEHALKVDLGWLRQQTTLQEQAARWSGREQTADSPHLLRGALLLEAQEWARRTPSGSAVPAAVREFIEASARNEERLKAEAQAGIAVREQALKDREVAITANARAQRRLRIVSLGALAAGVILSAAALMGGYLAAQNSVASSEARSALIAREANSLFDEGFHAKAVLMALYGDPAAQAGWVERLLRPEGYEAARNALVRGITHNQLAGTYESGSFAINLAFDQKGERFLSGHLDGKVRLWRVGEGKPVATFDAAEDQTGIWSVAFNPDGQRFLSGSGDGKAKLWRIGEDKPLATFDAGQGVVTSLVFSPDGEQFTIATEHGIRSWRIGQSEPLAAYDEAGGFLHADGQRYIRLNDQQLEVLRVGDPTVLGKIDNVYGLPSFSPDGQLLLAPGQGDTLAVWRIGDKEPVEQVKVGGGQIGFATFLADNERFLTSSEDGKIRLWKLEELMLGEKDPIAVFDGGGGVTISMVQHPDGLHFLSGSLSGRITMWRLSGDAPVKTLESPPRGVVFHPDGERFLSSQKGGKLTLWRLGEDRPLVAISPEGGSYRSIIFDRDGGHFLAGNADHKIRVWRTGENEPLATIDLGKDKIASAAFLPDDATFVAALSTDSVKSRLLLWQIGQDKPAATFETPDNLYMGSIAVFPDGQRFVTGDNAGKVRLWKVGGTKALQTFEVGGGSVTSLAVFPDGERFLTTSDDGKARLWRVGEKKPLTVFDPNPNAGAASLSYEQQSMLATQRPDGIFASAILPDGMHFLTVSEAGKMMLWRTGEERPLATLNREGVYALAPHPDGRSFLTASTGVVASEGTRISKWQVPEAALVSPARQIEIACATLKDSGVMQFSDADYARFPILDRNAPHPCAKLWGLDLPVNPGADTKTAATPGY